MREAVVEDRISFKNIYYYTILFEIYNIRRRARISRIERTRNEVIRSRMKAEDTVLDRIARRNLKWFGYILRMDNQRWPKRLFEGCLGIYIKLTMLQLLND